MKSPLRTVLTVSLCLAVTTSFAQFGAPGGTPGRAQISKSMAKLFGDTAAFTATVEIQTKGSSAGEPIVLPLKISFDQGNSRYEMDLSQMKGGPAAAQLAQMKSMGMDMEKMVTISRPDKKLNYVVYPGMSAYMEMALQDPEAAKADSDFKVELTELGKETVEGHPCVKNKAVVSDNQGTKHESTLWNATDLKKFPVKIEQTENGTPVTMLFKEIKFSKPQASQFEPPAGYTKYENQALMMREMMMKHIGGGTGGPPK